MMQQWNEEGQDQKFEQLFMEEWGKQWTADQDSDALQMGGGVIPFEPNNKYANNNDNTLKLAKQLVEVSIIY